MRQNLSLAIEVISLLTAIGLVISVVTYSVVFGLNGLSYTGIASFADMIRDSIQLLVVLLGYVTSLAAWTFMMELGRGYVVDNEDSSWARKVAVAVPFALVTTLILSANTFLFRIVSITAIRGSVPHKWPLLLLTTFSMSFLAHLCLMGLRGTDEIRRRTFWQILSHPFFVVPICAFTAIGLGYSVQRQLTDGLAVKVVARDKNLCAGARIVWAGDGKIILRCKADSNLVVQFLS